MYINLLLLVDEEGGLSKGGECLWELLGAKGLLAQYLARAKTVAADEANWSIVCELGLPNVRKVAGGIVDGEANGLVVCVVCSGIAEVLASPFLAEVCVIVRRDKKCGCDVFFGLETLRGVVLRDESVGCWRYVKVSYVNGEEGQYLDLLRKLLDRPARPNRTGVASRGNFCEVLKFGLEDERGRIVPLLTSRVVPWKSVVYELLWFVRGETSTEYLVSKGVNIWNLNSSRDYLDSRGLNSYEVGQLGPIYGRQWRCWGDEIDQLADVIEKIKNDPWDRRLVVSSWNVSDLPAMALPPCHYSFQFYVRVSKKRGNVLDCLVNMRSADVALGVPFNVASYSLLTHIVAQVCGLRSGRLALCMGDCHLYESHIPQIREQLGRRPRRFPIVKFSDRAAAAGHIDDFGDMEECDFRLVGYRPHGRIVMKMVV